MNAEIQDMIHFHLTGKRANSDNRVEMPQEYCPALMAPYRQLSKLRYDYPLILVNAGDTPAFVDTLTGAINRLLREIAPQGSAGARLRQHVLRLETRMRELVGTGVQLSLHRLWLRAEKALLMECANTEAELLKNSLATARFALSLDGKVVGCDASLPTQLLRHAWGNVEARRTRSASEQIDKLIINLRNILKVDDLKAGQSRTSQSLRQTFGRNYKQAFDFELMSEILDGAAPHNRLPVDRRNRVESVLADLESQKFFAREDGNKRDSNNSHYRFVFNSITNALRAFKERLPEMARVIKAIAVAELECENAYRESGHADYFDRFTEQALAPADLALFPSYLICLQDCECDATEKSNLFELASSDLPMKVLFQVSDILGDPVTGDTQIHSGIFSQQLANIFVAPGNAYVLQSTSSDLYQHREEIRKGLEFTGPAIFSIYTGTSKLTSTLPRYLLAAAAMESRVFPAFSYDPAAGADLVDRFSINSNPAIAAPWPSRELHYEDEALQAVSEEHAFTSVDFAVTDPRYVDNFVPAPRELWNDDMLPVANYLDLAEAQTFEKIPYVPVIDGNNILRRLVVDDKLIRVARRYRDRWHILQQQGGVNNSYASAVLAKERVALEEEQARQSEGQPTQAPIAEQLQPIEAESVQPVMDDEPYIDTPRCTTCDECTNKNDRMFAYDDNKQAFIKDPDAGSYRELVEAAEICQVAIIHPGKPRNQDESGLDELIERAQLFVS